MTLAFVDRLYPLVLTGDVAGAQALLASLEGLELTEARQWFGKSSRWLDSIPYETFGMEDHDLRHERWNQAKWILDLCALRLSGPATAARRVLWADHWSYRKDEGEEALVQALLQEDRDWVATFIAEACQVRLGGNARNSVDTLSRIVRTVGRHHELPCPTGPTFFEAWLAGCPEKTMDECLVNDPWMPDLLYNFLASGHCGGTTELPETIVALLDRGVLDRSALLKQLLSVLTAPQRPGSQQMLAKIVAILEPKPEEITGGLDYLLGVISTSAGAVGRVLLPLALTMVTNEDELAQLTAVISSRPEKDQKKRLLTALKTLPSRLGTEPVLAALEVLATAEDAAFAGQVRSLAAKLAPTPFGEDGAPADQSIPTLGLWDLEPSRQKPTKYRTEGFTFELHVPWPEFLVGSGRPKDREQTALVNQMLTALASSTAHYLDGLMDTVYALLAGGDLVMSRFTNLLPDLFLGGAMREVWPHVLALADTCAGRLTQPPSLAELLRTLARFAPEAPRQRLPPQLAVLAARKGNTKAQVEARVLGAALARVTPEVFRALLTEHPPALPRRSTRGLWRTDPPTGKMPEDIRLPPPEWEAATLVGVLGYDNFGYEESHHPLCIYPESSSLRKRPHTWVPELALVATVNAVYTRGAESVRRSLRDIRRRHQPLPIVTAIDLWVGGRLDVPTFWRLARHSERSYWNSVQEAREFWEGEWGRVGDLAGFTKALARDPELPVLRPHCVEDPVKLAMFLRACECLLLAESNGSVLSTPSWWDGTLELDDLLVRLEASGDAAVGPLDLIQALYRMRPVDRARADEVPVGRWFTDPALTSPDGGTAVDAGSLVRQWVTAGGLPPLDAVPSEQEGWSWKAAGPVPWSTSAAAPGEFDTNGGATLGWPRDLLRTFPMWPDVAGRYLGSSLPEERFPTGARGPFGTPLHANLLGLMSSLPDPKGYSYLPSLVHMAQVGRLDPTAAAAAMALPRGWRGRGWGGCRDEFGGLAHTFRRVFECGGMVGSWPSALAVGVVGLSAEERAGLDEYLRMLSDFAAEVPRPRASADVLAVLRDYAAQPGGDSVHDQARVLVGALEAP
jgi:hypothetical protein